MSSSVGWFIGIPIGKIQHEFRELKFPEHIERTFSEAWKLYNQGSYDHCLIEVFRGIETILKERYTRESLDPSNEKIAAIINGLKKKEIIGECDMHLLHGIRCYRNKVAHLPLKNEDRHIIDTILILTVPLIKKLIE
ncbi:MAG: DUF4145 domain-containing protein [Euryarchaeota archaeon]|nr:DUF4145 domain-containing protein [Euryarchaeota archaeon]